MFNWLQEPNPGVTLRRMHDEGTLASQLPEVDALYGVPQPAEHHPEVDTGRHIELSLDAGQALGASPEAMFAVLVHDLGKGLTPANEWPRHLTHEATGVPLVHQLCRRFGIDGYGRDLAALVCEYHLHAHRFLVMRVQSVIAFLEDHDLVQSPQRLADFVTACEADARGRLGLSDRPYPQADYMRQCAQRLKDLPVPDAVAPRDSREWQQLHVSRLSAIRAIRRSFASAESATAC